jgi:hypothetical protein
MAAYFASGRAADVIVAILLIEALWLIGSRRMRPVEVLGLAGPGLLIVLALRGALTGAPWPAVALPLAAAFPLHLLDLVRRMRPMRSRRRS